MNQTTTTQIPAPRLPEGAKVGPRGMPKGWTGKPARPCVAEGAKRGPRGMPKGWKAE